MRSRMIAVACVALVLFSASVCEGGATFDRVRSTRVLRCGVADGVAGFAAKDSAGQWRGLEADFCRAVAAAAGPGVKVEFVPLKLSARFVALKNGSVDLLVRSTTWTLEREAGIGVDFAGTLYFDSQAFMVPRQAGINRISQLKGAAVCVKKDTTTENNLEEYSKRRNLKIRLLVLGSQAEAEKAFFSGQCRAFTSDFGRLTSSRLSAPGGPEKYLILKERISMEPTGPAVKRGDDEWLRLVRWVLLALVTAEQREITRANVETVQKNTRDQGLRRLLGAESGYGKVLGTDDAWALRAIRSVGNYGEIFDRNLGRSSALKIERGQNKLWTRGGLMWAPPLR